ncbi:MAG: helix-turn-helix transcriptional regulator [Phycisphaerae bacterium]
MFSDLLQQARLKAGMTQEELAGKVHLTREYISLLERGKRTPTIAVFIRITRAVGLSPADLIEQIEKSMPTRK